MLGDMTEGFSQRIKKSNGDEYYTLRETVEAIVPYLWGRYKKILCPFDKEDSEYVKVLREYGFDVTYSHIDDGVDFFDLDLSGYDAVVSNPPFSQRQRLFEKLFESGVPFAMVMNFNGLFDSKSRWEMFRRNKFEILIPCGRWHYRDLMGTEINSPNFQSVYVCSQIADRQIEFLDRRIE